MWYICAGIQFGLAVTSIPAIMQETNSPWGWGSFLFCAGLSIVSLSNALSNK